MDYLDALEIEKEVALSLQQIVPPLLAWFQKNRRVMPWRDCPDPYHIWVSEIMLQQTRVEAVRGYFQRFLAELPTIQHLAQAPEQQLLKLWEGLGYYNRVRNLKKGAVLVVETFDGQLPPDFDALKTIPGIGDYTAGAIASLAFGIAAPAVDGNVYRVLSRLTGSFANTSKTAVQRSYRQLVMSILPKDQPGNFNQSLMELGALVCRPNGLPFCDSCPLETLCVSKGEDWVLDLPVKNPPSSRTTEHRTLLFYHSPGQLLVTQRPPSGLLANLWQPINLKGRLKEEEVAAHWEQQGVSPCSIKEGKTAKHIFSHREWELSSWWIQLEQPFPAPKRGRWISSLEEVPLPSAFSSYLPEMEQLLR